MYRRGRYSRLIHNKSNSDVLKREEEEAVEEWGDGNVRRKGRTGKC